MGDLGVPVAPHTATATDTFDQSSQSHSHSHQVSLPSSPSRPRNPTLPTHRSSSLASSSSSRQQRRPSQPPPPGHFRPPPLKLAVAHVVLSTITIRLAVVASQVVPPTYLVWFPPIRGIGTIVLCLAISASGRGLSWSRLTGRASLNGGGPGGYERVMTDVQRQRRDRGKLDRDSADEGDTLFAFDVEDLQLGAGSSATGPGSGPGGSGRMRTGRLPTANGALDMMSDSAGRLSWKMWIVLVALLAMSGPLGGWSTVGRWTWNDIGMGQAADALMPSVLALFSSLLLTSLPPPSPRIRSLLTFTTLLFGLLLLPLPSLTHPSFTFFCLSIPFNALLLLSFKRLLLSRPPGGPIIALVSSTLLATLLSLLLIALSRLLHLYPGQVPITVDDSAILTPPAPTLVPSEGGASRLESILRASLTRTYLLTASRQRRAFAFAWGFVGALDEVVLCLLLERASSPVNVALLAVPRGFLTVLFHLGAGTSRKVGPGRLEQATVYLMIAGAWLAARNPSGGGSSGIFGSVQELGRQIPGIGRLFGRGKFAGIGLNGGTNGSTAYLNGNGNGNSSGNGMGDTEYGKLDERDYSDSELSDSPTSLIHPLLPTSPRTRRLTSFLSLLPLLLFLLRQLAGFASDPLPLSALPSAFLSTLSLGTPFSTTVVGPKTLDIVISYYDESYEALEYAVKFLREHPKLQTRIPRFVVYVKNEEVRLEEVAERMGISGADEIRRLENRGREGGTYLSHILLEYNGSVQFPEAYTGAGKTLLRRQEDDGASDSDRIDPPPPADSDSDSTIDSDSPSSDPNPSSTSTSTSAASPSPTPSPSLPPAPLPPLIDRAVDHLLLYRPPSPTLARQGRGVADHTLFMQGHLAWGGLAESRVGMFDDATGFLSLGPYVESDCGNDLRGNGEFGRLRDIYTIFEERFCGPEHQLTSYAAQYFVSKKRILANPLSKYAKLEAILDADADHWIHKEGTWWHYHGVPSPTNPFLGHAVERSWPIVFGCTNASVSIECPDDSQDEMKCQCWDKKS